MLNPRRDACATHDGDGAGAGAGDGDVMPPHPPPPPLAKGRLAALCKRRKAACIITICTRNGATRARCTLLERRTHTSSLSRTRAARANDNPRAYICARQMRKFVVVALLYTVMRCVETVPYSRLVSTTEIRGTAFFFTVYKEHTPVHHTFSLPLSLFPPSSAHASSTCAFLFPCPVL